MLPPKTREKGGNMAKPLPDISLSNKERPELTGIVRRSTAPQHKVLRAKIVLLAEKKMSTEAIMKELNISKNTAVSHMAVQRVLSAEKIKPH